MPPLPREFGSANSPARRRAIWGVWLVAVVMAAVAGYHHLFSTFAPYDDEGYVMVSLSQYLEGKPLYDGVYSQYGPAYFTVEGALHRLTGLPITHDTVRLKTLFAWLMVSGLLASFALRICGSHGLAVAVFAAVFLHLDRLCMEPGHPQALCLVGVAAALWLTSFVRGASALVGAGGTAQKRGNLNNNRTTIPSRRWDLVALAGAMGCAAAVVAMTKCNAGAFLFLPLFLAMMLHQPRCLVTQFLTLALIAAGAALPLVVCKAHITDSRAFVLPTVVSLSWLAASISAWRAVGWPGFVGTHAARRSGPGANARDSKTRTEGATFGATVPIAFVAVLLLTCMLFALAAVESGTAWKSLPHALVGQHLGFAEMFYRPLPRTYWCGPFIAVAMLLIVVRSIAPIFASRLARWSLLAVGALAVVKYLLDTSAPLHFGPGDRGNASLLLAIAPAFCWVLVVPPQTGGARTGDADVRATLFPRMVLSLAGIMHALLAYPVPGTQAALGSVLLLVGSAIAGFDAIRGTSMERAGFAASSRWMAVAAMALLVVLGCRGAAQWQVRAGFEPLGLPGASHLRLPSNDVAVYRWLSKTASDCGETIVFGQHGHNSLYLWTGLRPPTGYNATFWRYLMLTDEHQEAIVKSLSRTESVCVVCEEFNAPPPEPQPRLSTYIERHFEPTAAFDKYEVWTRKRAIEVETD